MPTETEVRHTPTPWKQMTEKGLVIQGPNGENIGYAWSDKMPNCEENAAFIVRAVNAHEELLDLLKQVREFIGYEPNSEIVKRFDKVIAKAEGR